MLNKTGTLLDTFIEGLPTPLAAAFATVERSNGAVERLTFLLKAAEIITKYLALVEIATYIDSDGERDPEVERTLAFLRHPAFGTWARCLRKTAKWNLNHTDDPLARELFQRSDLPSSRPLLELSRPGGKKKPTPLNVIDAFVPIRNENAHGLNPEEQAKKYNDPLLSALCGLVQGLPDLARRSLVFVSIANKKWDSTIIEYWTCIGTRQPRPRRIEESDSNEAGFAADELFLWEQGKRALRVSPLIHSDVRGENIYQFSGVQEDVPIFVDGTGNPRTAAESVVESFAKSAGFLLDCADCRNSNDAWQNPVGFYRQLVELLVREGESEDVARDVMESVRLELHLSTDAASAIHADCGIDVFGAEDRSASSHVKSPARENEDDAGSPPLENHRETGEDEHNQKSGPPTSSVPRERSRSHTGSFASTPQPNAGGYAQPGHIANGTSVPMLQQARTARPPRWLYIAVAALSGIVLLSTCAGIYLASRVMDDSPTSAGVRDFPVMAASEIATSQAIMHQWIPFTHNGRNYLAQAHEATLHQYTACRSAGRCGHSGLPANISSSTVLAHFCTPSHGGQAVRPVNCLSPGVARQLCAYIGVNDEAIARPARIPTYSEWLAATRWTARRRTLAPCNANFCDQGYVKNVSARGGQPCSSRRIPFTCNDRWGGTSTIGVFGADVDERGMADVLGNVSEIVIDPDGGFAAAGYNFRYVPGPRDDALIRRGFPATDSGVQYGVRCVVDGGFAR